MKLLTLAATAALALSLLSTASLPAEAKEEVLMTTVPASGIPVSEFYKQSVYDSHDTTRSATSTTCCWTRTVKYRP